MKQANDNAVSRRRFLQTTLLTGGVAAVAGHSVATAAESTPHPTPSTTRQGYRVTAHVRRYYDSARLI